MKLPFRKTTGLLALSLLLITKLSALSLSDSNVVGIVNGQPGNSNVSTERGYAQHLLDMGAGLMDGYYHTGINEFDGAPTNVLVGGLQTDTSVSGYDWGLAKYDGDNGGYVLFWLGGALASTIVPQYPADIWTTNPTQYAISHLTVFNPSTTNVPDSGATVILMALGLLALGLGARSVGTVRL